MSSLSEHMTFGKLLRFVLPMIFMLIFMSIYYMVDGFFVSNYVGKTPFAGLNVIFPALMMFSSLGFMFSSGGSALVSKELGQKKEDEARASFTTIILACLACSIVLSLAGFLLTPWISAFLGAEGDLLDYSILYGRLLFPALPFFVLQNTLQGFLMTAGRGPLGFRFILVSGMANILLDALFVAELQWGAARCGLRHHHFPGSGSPLSGNLLSSPPGKDPLLHKAPFLPCSRLPIHVQRPFQPSYLPVGPSGDHALQL